MGYVATMRLKPVTDGDRTFWEWRSEFRPPEHRREELTALVRDGVYRAGFEAIRKMFGWRRAARSAAPPAPDDAASWPSAPAAERCAPSATEWPTPAVVVARRSASSTRTTRAIVVERYGGPEVLEFKEIALPAPARARC